MYVKGNIATEATLWQYFVIPLIHLQLSFIKKTKTILSWNCRKMHFGGQNYINVLSKWVNVTFFCINILYCKILTFFCNKFSRGSSPFLSAEGAGLLPPLHKAADSAPATLQFPPATFFQFENRESGEGKTPLADIFPISPRFLLPLVPGYRFFGFYGHKNTLI